MRVETNGVMGIQAVSGPGSPCKNFGFDDTEPDGGLWRILS